MNLIAFIGTCAAICSVASFAPQAWKIIKTRDTSSLSAPMYLLTVVGFLLWTTYGIGNAQWTIIVPNFVCCVLSAFIFTMILLPKRARNAVADKLEKPS
jgi:MtN3 and saliva related transmembrane protein